MTLKEDQIGTSAEEELPVPSITRGIHRADGVSVVELEGEVDLSSFDQLRDALIEAAESPDIIIDMSRVRYMDSSGFGTLLSATKVLRPLGGNLHLVGCNPHIERMLVVTRLNTMFCVHDGSEVESGCRISAGQAVATAGAV